MTIEYLYWLMAAMFMVVCSFHGYSAGSAL